MDGTILVLNAGSSSLKFSLYHSSGAGLALVRKGQPEAIRALLDTELKDGPPAAVGHRVVHGGGTLREPVRITPAVLAELKDLIPLAPLHQPKSIEPIELLLDRFPKLPQVACFDTAFHATQPELASAIALPPEITERGVRRYGFHGLSYEYISSVLPKIDPRAAKGKAVVLHLGNGASMCALENGKCIATTMGFSALDGLVMSTRSGAIDPGVLLYLLDELKLSPKDLETLLYKQSGLLGVSGVSGDMRALLASAEPRARFAVDLFLYRIRRELGSLVAALGGIDAIIFTAGIGEHSAEIRKRICRDAAWLGVELDEAANESGRQCLSTKASPISAWMIPTDEELMIARHTAEKLGG